MTPYPFTMQSGMKRLHGHLFLAPQRLYFVCTKQGGAWAAAIGQSLGGVLGHGLAALMQPKPGEAPPVIDEAALQRAVAENDGSLIMEASQIEEIKETIWWRLVRWNGKKFGLPNGIDKQLRPALGAWAREHGVKTKGLPS